MNITRTLLLVLITAVLLGGLTTTVRAQAGQSDTKPRPKLTKEDEAKPTTTAPATTTETTTQPAKPASGFFENPMFLLIGAMLLMFIFMGRGKRKKEKQRKEMLATLKKGDKVTTIGGIIGTVMEARDDEVIVKIDESSNARMRFARWAVRGIGDQAKTEEPEDKK